MKPLLDSLKVIGLIIFITAFASSAAAEKLVIVGTGSGTAILKAIAAAFHEKYPDITIEIPPSIGSGGGVKAVGRDEYTLGRVARKIKDKEKPYGLTYIPYAKIPVVFYTNKSVSVKQISTQQVLDIYQGKITDWKDVGVQKGPIRVVKRNWCHRRI